MKKKIFVFLCLNYSIFALFHDVELEQLWSTIDDINHPTLEEYQSIDRYLRSGKRPYLDLLRFADPFDPDRMNRILDFQLINQEQMPIYETYAFNCDESTRGRCIVLYGSSNSTYPDKAKKLLREIKESGYSGHVLFRIGGFPNTQFAGLKICHVPYAFKVAFLQEARRLRFKEVLWLDLAIHPLDNFERIFWEIEQTGYFFTFVGTLQDNRSTHLLQAAEALQITTHLYHQIPHISSSVIGLNMENEQALQLLDAWYQETEKLYPSMSWWPEELSLSVIAWRLKCAPTTSFGNFVCTEKERWELNNRPNVQFYLDAMR